MNKRHESLLEGAATIRKQITIEEIMERKAQYLRAIQPLISTMASVIPQKRVFIKDDPLGDFEDIYYPDDQAMLDRCKETIDQIAKQFFGDLEDCVVVKKG